MNESHGTTQLAAGRAVELPSEVLRPHAPASSIAHLSGPTSRLVFARHLVEMAAAMLVPSAVAAVPAALGVLGAGAALGVQHVVMAPAMLAVMLWRYEEYARPHAVGSGQRLRAPRTR